jgi:hypothetical protein
MRYVALLPPWVHELYCRPSYSYHTTRCHSSENRNLNINRRKNKCHSDVNFETYTGEGQPITSSILLRSTSPTLPFHITAGLRQANRCYKPSSTVCKTLYIRTSVYDSDHSKQLETARVHLRIVFPALLQTGVSNKLHRQYRYQILLSKSLTDNHAIVPMCWLTVPRKLRHSSLYVLLYSKTLRYNNPDTHVFITFRLNQISGIDKPVEF